ncbi:MAG: DUF4301 family protein [Tannerella sp.]|jgi:hypothetical protein|nr:DUF4301 family protein [Tannerella sp.]
MIKDNDLLQLKTKNLTEAQINEQLSCFINGFPCLEVKASATVEKGVRRPTKDEEQAYVRTWTDGLASGIRVTKFVPASGAASRMFKDLYAFLDAPRDAPETGFEQTFFADVKHFAFYDALNAACLKLYQTEIPALTAAGRYKDVVAALLNSDGLNCGSLPKGLLIFHHYSDGARTAMEEHLIEGATCARTVADNTAYIHFTVSPEHLPLFRKLLAEKQSQYEQKLDVKFDVTFSLQRPDTDTIAVDMANAPLRDVNGSLVFRPGGHGALIHNLDSIEADVIFIKNIDNIVSESFHDALYYKKVLAGVLLAVQRKIFDYTSLIESGGYTQEQVAEMIHFLQDELCIKNPDTKYLEDVELILYIKRKLQRPLRVCGMVRNTGEPGGGPFLAVNPDSTVSPQIAESTQIDMSNPTAKTIYEHGSHFNPVDLVCAVRDAQGNKYHLPDYVDRNTGFISIKSKDGRELKALELPGLWNGAMSDWNTIFVEVPIETFNPVKTVNDLLREQHAAKTNRMRISVTGGTKQSPQKTCELK